LLFYFGLRGCVSGLAVRLFRGRLLQDGKNHGGCALDDFKTFRQQRGVAVVKLDVIG
jgi:hypothetical protein